MERILLKPWVCVGNSCNVCPVSCTEVPEECQFGILHALDVGDMGLVAVPRRYGKSRRLKEVIGRMMAAGADVTVVCQDIYEFQGFLSAGVRLLSFEQVKKGGLVGIRTSIFTDEIDEDKLKIVMENAPGSRFVLGYHTPPPVEIEL